MNHMKSAAIALTLALLCGTLGAQQHKERPLRSGTWEVRFVHYDRL